MQQLLQKFIPALRFSSVDVCASFVQATKSSFEIYSVSLVVLLENNLLNNYQKKLAQSNFGFVHVLLPRKLLYLQN